MPFGNFWGFSSGFSGIFATMFFDSKLGFGEKRELGFWFFLQQARFWGKEKARALEVFWRMDLNSEKIEGDWKLRDLIAKLM